MNKTTSYTQAFWGTEFTSTAGFDTLARHNYEQRKFLQEYEEYLRKRSKMELEYSKSLTQLSKSMKDYNVGGVLGEAWQCLKGELENRQQTHQEAGLFFTQHAEETRRFCRDLTSRRDSMEERIKKLQNQKNSQYNKLMTLHKTYTQKCREQDECKEQYSVLRSKVTSTTKELEKAITRRDKSVDEATKADAVYKTAVQTLDEIRLEWEREMERGCKEFQESDEQQIHFMRCEIWLAANKDSEVALAVDQSSEKVRQLLENCNINEDILTFINTNTTGTVRPERVVYQNYYADNSNSNGQSPKQKAPQKRLPLPAQAMQPPLRSPVAMKTLYDNAIPGSSVYSTVDSSPYCTIDSSVYSTAEPISDDLYATADPPQGRGPCVFTVIKPYTSQSPSDLTVQVGEIVTLVRRMTPYIIQVRSQQNKCGNIPVVCVREKV
ncbi:proline-serine-threonine phosphatase-interacting protein 2-like [Pomacea canaliculata]|uniref:proline-serine-threonine phosphatase-interacting protein 2-like n=1 Tax=Pomacea canaliculata TaxID=400727 RepID=UPI000D73A53C|nr:proline-serine-threonine phosphatase-interacting protein 2-like [Pomacea canaliculata]